MQVDRPAAIGDTIGELLAAWRDDPDAQKLASSYAHAEKRIGSGDLPPEAPDAYAYTPPEEYKDLPLDAETVRAQMGAIPGDHVDIYSWIFSDVDPDLTNDYLVTRVPLGEMGPTSFLSFIPAAALAAAAEADKPALAHSLRVRGVEVSEWTDAELDRVVLPLVG